MRLFLILLSYLLLGVTQVYAKSSLSLPPNLNLDHLNLGENALSNEYNQVVRQGNGYIWIATDKSLERYDGYAVKRYEFLDERTDSINSNGITWLFVASDNTLWLASGDQLARYNEQTDSFSVISPSPTKIIRNIFESQDGTLWLVGDDHGLMAIDPKTLEITNQYFTEPSPTPFETAAQSIEPDKVWLANDEGLVLFNLQTRAVEKRLSNVSPAQGIDQFVEIIQHSSGALWIASGSGLYQVDPTTGDMKHYSVEYQRPNGIKSRMVTALLEDSKGRLWIGTDKRGIHVYRPDTDDFAHYRSSETNKRFLPVASIHDIYEDHEGTIWLSLNSFGIVKFNLHLNKFESLFAVEGDANTLSSNNVFEMHESADGTIWVATDGAGLNRYDPLTNQVKQYRNVTGDPTTLSSDAVLTIAEDSRGNLWLGTWAGGLNYFDVNTGTFTRYQRNPALPVTHTLGSNHVYDIRVIDDNTLLITCWGFGVQVFHVDTGRFESYSPRVGPQTENSVTGLDIRSITPGAEKDSFWLSGYSGLEHFDLATGKATLIDFPAFGVVTEVYVESENLIWVASLNGLFEYIPQSQGFRYHKISDYAPSNTVISIEPDDQGRLWLGTREGLAVFDKTTHHVEFFDTGDGLTGEKFNIFSHLRTRDGTLYFGTIDGLNRFKPESFPRNNTPPQVKLTSLELRQKAITLQDSAYLTQDLSHTDHLILPHHESDIGFEFAALSFIYPQKNQYRYRLQGFDRDWIKTSADKRSVRYTNLPYGDYLFEVEASNNDGVWSESPRQLKVTIETPWWALWWVRGIFTFAAAMGIYSLTSVRVWHSKRREKQLNALVASRTTELQAANDEVVTLNQELEERVAVRTEELSKEVVERRNAEKRLYHLAYHDVLTGLPNRSWLLNKLNRHMVEEPRITLGVVFLDGDRFKRINDTYGHIVGDELLNAAALRLRNVLVDGQTAIRLGGDEFVVLAEKNVSVGSMRLLAEAIIDTFSQVFSIRHYVFDFQVSVGVVICDSSYQKAEECLRDADIAMYEAKHNGRGNYQFFNLTMRERELVQNELEADLKHAMQSAQLVVEYSPVLTTTTKQLYAFEAILKWQHPTRGLFAANELFNLAADSGQVYDIGIWLFEKTCREYATWKEQQGNALLPKVILPVSSVQLNASGLIDHFVFITRQHQIKPEQLVILLNEEVLYSNNKVALDNLKELQTKGFDIMIDRFGSGHGALTHLHELGIKQVKLEPDLLDKISRCKDDSLYEVTKATTTLCKNLNIGVVACGIANTENEQLAMRLACSFIEGGFVAAALSAADAVSYIAKPDEQML